MPSTTSRKENFELNRSKDEHFSSDIKNEEYSNNGTSLWAFVNHQIVLRKKKKMQDLVWSKKEVELWKNASTTSYVETLHMKNYDFETVVRPAVLRNMQWILHGNCANVKSPNPLLVANDRIFIRSMKSPSELLCVRRNIHREVKRYAAWVEGRRKKRSSRKSFCLSP
jgi:hypothetical protein